MSEEYSEEEEALDIGVWSAAVGKINIFNLENKIILYIWNLNKNFLKIFINFLVKRII
jgi:hypothetical protein